MSYVNDPAHLVASRRLLTPIKEVAKQPAAIAQITRLARNLGAGAKLPTFREFCAFLEITPTTLERCLRRLEEQDIVIRQNRSGMYVSPALDRKTTGVIFSAHLFSHEHAFFASLLDGCARRAEVRGERFSFFVSSPASGQPPLDLQEAVRDNKIDGVIDLSYSVTLRTWFEAQSIPVVRLDSGKAPHTICLDGQKQSLACLKEFLKRGSRTVGLIGMPEEDRTRFHAAAVRIGLQTKPEWIVCRSDLGLQAGSFEDYGRQAAKRMLKATSSKTRPLPTALLITNDMVARGALPVLEAAGFRLGHDLHVAACTNRGAASLLEWEDKLIRSEIDPAEVVEALCTMLENLMHHRPLIKAVTKIHPHLRLPS